MKYTSMPWVTGDQVNVEQLNKIGTASHPQESSSQRGCDSMVSHGAVEGG